MVFSVTRTSPILFGVGAVGQIGVKVAELGCKRVMLVTDKGVKAAGIVDRVSIPLREAGVEIVEYSDVLGDPPDHMIEECAALARQNEVDGVVAVGGGSAMDTGKAVNILLTNPPPISRYYGVNAPQRPAKPLVLVPTTSGTGSEVTAISVVTDTRKNKKIGVIGPNCMASLAIVDPALTAAMPGSLTAATGMDTFSHAAEALTSRLANPFSDVLAERAIALTVRYLPAAVENGQDMEARTNMSLACTIAGVAFNDALPHLGHAIAHTLGARFHIHHGVGCALALPAVIENVADVAPAKVRIIAAAMGLDLAENASPEEVGRSVAEAVRRFCGRIGIPSLRELKVEGPSLEALAPAVLEDDCAAFVPKPFTADAVAGILRNIYQQP